ncbi:MAG: hypothetical protein BMS9Abin34_255 [Patescibacteria group bacterium]|nr:MAG: hypothetical protein BMS9Abin34_255 [Patescibacteria group bacterium]
MQEEKAFRKLDVWKKADELAFEIYRVTRMFPKEEVYGITSQMRRAALSMPANIAEGSASPSDDEQRRFYNIARGSLTELEYFLDFSHRLGYIPDNNLSFLVHLREETGRLLSGLIKSTRTQLAT